MSLETLYQESSRLRNALVTSPPYSPKEYLVVGNFLGTSMETSVVGNIFRTFEPVKPEQGRKLNTVSSGIGFDIYSDTLMDYPTIIGNKMNRPWKEYNRLASLHVPACNLKCWHCYTDDVLKCLGERCHASADACPVREECGGRYREHLIRTTAENVVERFLKMKFDTEIRVLRITGGEPFLVPDLIYEILAILERRGLHREVFVWTETNLTPMLKANGQSIIDQSGIGFRDLSRFKNLAIHPCFHGLSEESASRITSVPLPLEARVRALCDMIDAGLDVYPTFGANIEPLNLVEPFFLMLDRYSPRLPLRVALIKFSYSYPPIEARHIRSPLQPILDETVAFESAIYRWDALLKKHYGVRYADVPRHLIHLQRCGENANGTQAN